MGLISRVSSRTYRGILEIEEKTMPFDDKWLRAHCGHFDPSTVSKLDISGKQLRELPELIKCFTSLKYLNLADNDLNDEQLAKISTRYLPLLEEVDFKNNARITAIDNMILPMPKSKLEMICLEGTGLTHLPSGLEDLEKLNILNTPLNQHLESNSETSVFNYSKLAWLNNEPVISTGKHHNGENNFENSFYKQRRLILKHLELGLPFEKVSIKDDTVTEKFEIPVPQKFELEIPAKLGARLDKTRREIDEKLAKLDSLLT